MVLVVAHIGSEPQIAFHLRVVFRHELPHLVRHVVLSLSLNRVFIVLQLTSEQISLGLLVLSFVLVLELLFAVESFAEWVVLDAAIGDVIRVSEPNVVAVVAHKFRVHFQNLDASDFLQVVADLETLKVGISLKHCVLQEIELIFKPEFFVKNLPF